MANIARIIEIVEPEVKARGFDLVRVRFFGRSDFGDEECTLQIMAERPETGQLLMDDCVVLSHRISDKIDALEEAGDVVIHEVYRLEVSSPGIDRPLTRLKDWVEWVGHEARVTLINPVDTNRKTVHGILAGVEEDIILFDDKKSGRVTFPLADVQSGKLVLTDRLIAATKPIDIKGVDDIVEDADDETELTEAQED